MSNDVDIHESSGNIFTTEKGGPLSGAVCTLEEPWVQAIGESGLQLRLPSMERGGDRSGQYRPIELEGTCQHPEIVEVLSRRRWNSSPVDERMSPSRALTDAATFVGPRVIAPGSPDKGELPSMPDTPRRSA